MAEPEAGGKPVESFEACLDELEKVVRDLEAGDLSLERSLELFERGVSLSGVCRKRLEDAETRIETLIRKDGKLAAEPFQPVKPEK
jgi:exodeoxyribonuclease VII small subunit